ncbi:MAG: hypothetical protein Ct9H300mP1_21290 [Planctomycetaceae bacterium]|nr:MAG: hypothetical protein Ct9H300mP1_21290 [Planctomycetaceae bacterium]
MVAYLAEITFFDSQVGRCRETARETQADENTLVLVLSKQGSSFPFGKWTCYDTGCRVRPSPAGPATSSPARPAMR